MEIMFQPMKEVGEISPDLVTDTADTSKMDDNSEASGPKPEAQQLLSLKTLWLKDYDGETHEVEFGVGLIFPVLAAKMKKGMGTSRDNAIALPYKVKVSMLMPTYDCARAWPDPFAPEEVVLARTSVFNRLVRLDPVSLNEVIYACEKLGFYSPEREPAKDAQMQRLRKVLANRKVIKRMKEENVQLPTEVCPIGYLISKFSADSEKIGGSSSKSVKNKKKKQRRKDRKRNASSINTLEDDDNMDSEFKRKLQLHEKSQEEELIV